MASSWTIYASATTDAALRAVDAMYAALEELYEKVDLGDGDSAPDLGFLPDVEVSRSPVPKADAERAAVAESAKIGARVEDAAFARLSKCKSTLIVDRPTELDEDPTLVSALKILFEMLGPSVFVGGDAHRLVTSETLLAELAKHRDLDAAIKARGGKPEKLRELRGQFRKPVWPGDTLITRGWNEGDKLIVRTTTKERPEEIAFTNSYAVVG